MVNTSPALFAAFTARVTSPTPVTKGTRSTTSPAKPAHAQGSVGFAITSHTLTARETISKKVSQNAPSISFRITGLLSQYANRFFSVSDLRDAVRTPVVSAVMKRAMEGL